MTVAAVATMFYIIFKHFHAADSSPHFLHTIVLYTFFHFEQINDNNDDDDDDADGGGGDNYEYVYYDA